MNREFTRAPHRAPEAMPSSETAALLIDFDNVTMGIRSNLGQELRKLLESDIIRGKVAVQRAYADWRRYPQYIVPLSEASIDLIFAPAYGSSKKNATDIRMAIDGLELVFTRPEIGTFILLTGDSDFSSLVLKLKEYGKYVIGVGLQESASDILVQNCDEYYSYSQVSGLVSAADMKTETQDPWVLVSKAVRRMAERGDVMRSDRLKQVMLEIDQTFDEKAAGYSKFNRFLAEATSRNLIEMRKGQNGQYEVGPGSEVLGDDGPAAPATPAPTAKPSRSRRGGRSRGGSGRTGGREPSKTRSGARQKAAEAPRAAPKAADTSGALQAAYDALAGVVAELDDGAGVRDSMAKRKLIAQDAGFDEGGLGFAKFSLFLKRAAEDGVVRLEQRDDRNYYLSPAPAGSRSRPQTRTEPKESGQKKKGLLGRLFGGGQAKAEAEAPAKEETRQPEPDNRDVRARESDSRKRSGGSRSSGRQSGSGQGRSGQGRSRQGGSSDDGRSRGERGRGSQQGGGQQTGDGQRSGGQGPAARAQSKSREEKAPASEARPAQDERQKPRERPRREEPKQSEARKQPEEKRRQERKRPEERQQPDEPKQRDEAPAASIETPAPETPSEPEPRRLGRYRSGSRGRAPAKPAGSSSTTRIGPLPRGDETDEKPATSPEAKSTPASDAPRPSLRGRGGSRGGGRPAAEKAAETSSGGQGRQGSSSSPAAAAPAASGATERTGQAAEAVDHMVRNYAGVGKRTAEVLVDHFGASVFDVIDGEPARLTEVLSEGRAKSVIAAREQERDG